jgi:uncharacterized protein
MDKGHIKAAFWLLVVAAAIILQGCARRGAMTGSGKAGKLPHDCHVHIMSPQLVNDWKQMGIQFSRPDYYYSDIDSIVRIVNTEKIDLISMAHVYTSEEFYSGNDGPEKLSKENDFVLEVANKYPKTIRPFISIDPLKTSALEELERCHNLNNNIGLKMHFSASQVYLTVQSHLNMASQMFNWAADKGLPILLHFDNWHPKFGARDLNILVDSILANSKPLTITIAHFGTSGGFSQKTIDFIEEYVALVKEHKIPKQHKVYLDISAVALDKDSEGVQKLKPEQFVQLKTYILNIGSKNIAFGTDYPLYTPSVYADILRHKVGLKNRFIKQILAIKK